MINLPMTAAGHAALENELRQRIAIERPRLIQRIQEAIADDTNLAENSEYQAAKIDQEINEARILELEDRLARAEVIDVSKLSGDTIKFGASVTLIEEDTGAKKMWQIVGEPEADAHTGKISLGSPIARSLIGKTKGETVGCLPLVGARPTELKRWSGIEMVGEPLRARLHPQQPSARKRATPARGQTGPARAKNQ